MLAHTYQSYWAAKLTAIVDKEKKNYNIVDLAHYTCS